MEDQRTDLCPAARVQHAPVRRTQIVKKLLKPEVVMEEDIQRVRGKIDELLQKF